MPAKTNCRNHTKTHRYTKRQNPGSKQKYLTELMTGRNGRQYRDPHHSTKMSATQFMSSSSPEPGEEAKFVYLDISPRDKRTVVLPPLALIFSDRICSPQSRLPLLLVNALTFTGEVGAKRPEGDL